jgi:hypothetical protein
VFDDVVGNPEGVVTDVQRFLGLPVDPTVRLEPANARRAVRSIALQSLTKHPPAPVRAVARRFVPAQTRQRLASVLDGSVSRINLTTDSSHAPSPHASSIPEGLTQELNREVQALALLIGRDLSSWLAPAVHDDDSQSGTVRRVGDDAI